MKLAMIKNNIVENIIVVESLQKAQQLFPDHTFAELPSAEIGDSYVNGVLNKAPKQVVQKMSKYQFMNLFTTQELAGIYTKATTDMVVTSFLKKLEVSEHVDFSLPDVSLGLGYLVSVNCLTSQRKDEILALGQA